MTRRAFLLPVVVFAVALGIRAWHVQAIETSPFADVLMGDGRAYDAWAREIAAGDWIGDEVFYQAPLYPYFLGAIHAFVDDSPSTVRLVQAALGAAACALLAVATKRLFGARPGWIAGLFLALYAPAVFFDGIVQKSSLDVFLLACVVLSWVAWCCAPRARTAGLAGLAAGALVLARENALLLVPVLAGGMLLARESRRVRLGALALFAAGVAAVLAPVAWRNHSISGEWHLTTSQLGPNLWYGNNPDAVGTYEPLRAGRGDARYERADAEELAEVALGRELTPGEVSDHWRDRALAFIRDHPVRWLALVGRKLVLALGRQEVSDTEDVRAYADWSPPLRGLLPVLHFGVLLPLAVLGLFALSRGERRASARRASLGLLAMAAIYLASLLVFYVFARYRYPLVPLLLPFAALGLHSLPGILRERRFGALAAAVLVAVPANALRLFPGEPQRAMTYSNLGDALVDQGRVAEAIPWFERAIEIQPRFVEGWTNLAAAHLLLGDPEAAAGACRAALEIDPDDVGARYDLGLALEELGRRTDAELEFLRVVEVDPEFADAHFALGRISLANDDLPQAEERFRRTTRLRPSSTNSHSNLGIVLALQGRGEEARKSYDAALALEPDHANTLYNLGVLELSEGRAGKARALLERVAELGGDSADLQYFLGMSYGHERRASEAARHFRRALQLDPSHPAARRALDSMGGD